MLVHPGVPSSLTACRDRPKAHLLLQGGRTAQDHVYIRNPALPGIRCKYAPSVAHSRCISTWTLTIFHKNVIL